MAKDNNIKGALTAILLATVPVIIEKAGEIIKERLNKKRTDKNIKDAE